MNQQPPAKRPRIGVVQILVSLGLVGALGYVIWAFVQSWGLGSGAEMSVAGWGALAVAFVLTGALAGGLMWLAFYSARKGYDDNVGRDED
jgi:hypothetical protein